MLTRSVARATWNGSVLVESDDTVVVEGNHYFLFDGVADGVLQPSLRIASGVAAILIYPLIALYILDSAGLIDLVALVLQENGRLGSNALVVLHEKDACRHPSIVTHRQPLSAAAAVSRHEAGVVVPGHG